MPDIVKIVVTFPAPAISVVATGPTLAQFRALVARVEALENGTGSGSIIGTVVTGGDDQTYFQMTGPVYLPAVELDESGGGSGAVVEVDGAFYLKLIVSGTAYYFALLTDGITASGASGSIVTAEEDNNPYLKIVTGGTTYYSPALTELP